MNVKKLVKNSAHTCMFCEQSDRTVLDIHRIIPGCEGGEYTVGNVVCVCSNCHRKIHHGNSIKIDAWVFSTAGSMLHCWVDGEEQYLKYVLQKIEQ